MQDYLSDLYKKLSGKMKLGRQRAEQLMDALDHPEKSFRSIHIAGTNGKGTVTVVAAALLEAVGYRTGRFTSPHLLSFNERICVNREQIDDLYVREFLKKNETILDRTEASFFEVTTALGFEYFKDQKVDVAVVETGLGGRLDATSVLQPDVTVITRISFDHTSILGNTLREIAGEKAGIIKDRVPLLTALQEDEVIDVFLKHTQLTHIIDPETLFTQIALHPNGMTFRIRAYENALSIPLTGRHQLGNIALAIRAVETFLDRTLSPDEIQAGFDLVKWKGRFERLSQDPDIIYDVAHNPDSIHTFCKTAKEVYPDKHFKVVLGLLQDKSPEIVLMELEQLADEIWIAPVHSHRSMSIDELKDLASRFPRVNVAKDIAAACDEAYENMDTKSVLCIVGSHYIAEEVYAWKSRRMEG
jgi:dihydrofolate synthase/folylpolyglutamate synthase